MLPARVEMTESTGAETMTVLDPAGTQLIARLGAADRPASGEIVSFAVDTDKACLFDTDTKQRIA